MSSPLPSLILASTSSYRRELLHRLQLPFTVVAPGVDETPLPGEPPAELARRLDALLEAADEDVDPLGELDRQRVEAGLGEPERAGDDDPVDEVERVDGEQQPNDVALVTFRGVKRSGGCTGYG